MHPSHASRQDFETGHSSEPDHFIKKGPVRCTCPKCGMTHVLNFLWTGRGTPRKYCHRCRETVSAINENFVYESSPDIFRPGQSAPSANE